MVKQLPKRKPLPIVEIRDGETPKEALLRTVSAGKGGDYIPPAELIMLPETRQTQIEDFSTEGWTIEMIECAEILKLNDSAFVTGKKLSMREIAEMKGLHERTLWGKMRKWRDSGIYERVRNELMIVKRMAIEEATNDVLTAIPKIYERLVYIATEGGSGKNAIEAAKLLLEQVIRPALVDSGGNEDAKGKDYLSVHKDGELPDPTKI